MDGDSTAQLAFGRLQRAYADISTRFAHHEFESLITPDARLSFDTHSGQVFEINGAAEFAVFGAKMVERFSFYEYIPLNFVATVDDDGTTARGRTYNLEIAEDAESGEWIEFYCVYQDEYALYNGEWRFSRRHCQTYGRRTGGRLERYPLPTF